jgi:hypothetical protein
VIATWTTFQGELFARLVERFGRDATIHTKVCPGLVERVEAGQTDDPETEELLREYLTPMLEAGIDSLVLGCTHYPFLRPAIDRVLAGAGCDVVVIDPAPAVARQTGCVVANLGKLHQARAQRPILPAAPRLPSRPRPTGWSTSWARCRRRAGSRVKSSPGSGTRSRSPCLLLKHQGEPRPNHPLKASRTTGRRRSPRPMGGPPHRRRRDQNRGGKTCVDLCAQVCYNGSVVENSVMRARSWQGF